MRDDLLARVDRTIRESRLVRDQARETLAKARIAGANARATLRLARAVGERSVSLYRETASKAVVTLEHDCERSQARSGPS